MRNEQPSRLRCPVCREELKRASDAFICPSNHSFDIAREQYVNLLLSKKGVAREKGDSREMLQARTLFYKKGHYDFISNALIARIDQIVSKASSNTRSNILEIGCGEGNYLQKLSESHLGPEIGLYGIDVSKDAARMTGRALRNGTVVLANVHHEIPVVDHSISTIFAIFSPRNFNEFSRILVPDGSCLLIIPTPKHLIELRSYVDLLAIEQDKERQVLEAASGFELIDTVTLEHQADLTSDELQLLITMTPNFWHLPRKTIFPVELKSLSLTFSITMLHLKKRTPQN